MKQASRFAVSASWKLLLLDMQIDPFAVLARANLPADLFNREGSSLSPPEYFRMWQAVEVTAGDRELPLLVASHFKAESFDPALFACLCCPNFNSAVTRLSQYKPLIGPMHLAVAENERITELQVQCYGYEEPLPRSLAAFEVVFLTQLFRMGTREHIQPLRIELPNLPNNLPQYFDYFGVDMQIGESTKVIFSAEDATKPFLTANAPMLGFFEEGLSRRLADLNHLANTYDRVRAVLLDSLPSGLNTIEHVAEKLAMSRRTLQRKLTQEGHSFQSVLNEVRSELANHYLKKSSLSLSEISFLLGFNESNSFIRAFRSWTGQSPGVFRQQVV